VRRRLRLPALVLAAVGLVLALVPGTAGAAALDAAGWWSRTSTSPLPVNPVAPTAGEDQLVVQGEPSGANAIAALRWTLADGESSPTLTITAADGSVVPPDALILACRAGTPWTEASGEPIADGPKVDCATSVNGIVGDDGTITFALSSLLDGTTLDVVLVPGENPDGGGSTFSLVFDRPAADALVTTAGGGDQTTFDPGAAGGGFSGGDFSGGDAFAGSDAGSGSFTAPSSGGGSSFTAPATDAVPAAEPALPEENQVAIGSGGQPPVAAQNAAATDRDRVRTLGIVVLLLGTAVAAWAFMAQSRVRAGAGAAVPAPVAGEATPGGLGRFVRPRTGAPPSLS
jgi:hypothetical protein